jgi:hypothetical protein
VDGRLSLGRGLQRHGHPEQDPCAYTTEYIVAAFTGTGTGTTTHRPMAGASGNDSGGGGSGSKRFSGADPEQYKTFKSNMMASLLARDKKQFGEGPPQHDTTTWGPFIIKQLDGDAAEIFEEADLEADYAIPNGHRKVFKELEDMFPQKNKVETK